MDHYERVQQMILDNGETWDLSPNDKAALRHVLGLVNSLADHLAQVTGRTVPQVIRGHSLSVKEIQSTR